MKTMNAQMSRLWNGEEESKGRSAPASTTAAVKLVIAVFVALVVLVFVISNSAISKAQSKPQPKPITLSCPNHTAASAVCQRSPNAAAPTPLHLTATQPSPTCPEYFRWIHEDLRPWKSTGITKEMVQRARKFATFHMVVLDGRVYVQEYFGHSLSRNVFTFWGILQLISRYPGRVPDFELIFNCMDMPSVKSTDYNSSAPPPPLFHYCKDDQTVDILFPDWSFWGWYRIYVEGLAWSVSQKYIMACNSPTLFVDTRFVEFFQRGLMPGRHYWPIAADNKCRGIKFAVDWGNAHQEEAQAMGKASGDFFQQEVKMDHVYDYMLHALIEYVKLLKYKPTVPEGFTEICMESLACSASEKTKSFLLESMEKWTHDAAPCTLPPPFTPEELHQVLERRANAVKQVEMWEQKAWEQEQGNKST
ncbi:hypothetical protein GW17_00018478 [Ensete ventricosum]|nr:hypothetical protein GW17_00018478 [Ensete ventricosum]